MDPLHAKHDGTSLYSGIALVTAFIGFLAIIAWALLRPKREIDRIAQLPMEDDPAQATPRGRETK